MLSMAVRRCGLRLILDKLLGFTVKQNCVFVVSLFCFVFVKVNFVFLILSVYIPESLLYIYFYFELKGEKKINKLHAHQRHSVVLFFWLLVSRVSPSPTLAGHMT